MKLSLMLDGVEFALPGTYEESQVRPLAQTILSAILFTDYDQAFWMQVSGDRQYNLMITGDERLVEEDEEEA